MHLLPATINKLPIESQLSNLIGSQTNNHILRYCLGQNATKFYKKLNK